MSHVVVTIKGKEIQKHMLTQKSVRVGRGMGNDISLPNESVSREHALISYLNHSFWIQPLNETNGLWVNGQVCQQATLLNDGDRIQIGKYTLTLFVGKQVATHNSAFDAFQKTEALSIDDLQKYATPVSTTDSRSFEEVRTAKIRSLEIKVKVYKVLFFISLLAHLYTYYY